MAPKDKLVCKFGNNCYRKNKEHLLNYSHKEIGTIKDAGAGDDVDEGDKGDDGGKGFNADNGDNGETSSSEPVAKRSKLTDFFKPKTNGDIKKINNTKAMKCVSADRDFVSAVMGAAMPDDFFAFWDYCVTLDPYNPIECMKKGGLLLKGAYCLLADDFDRSQEMATLQQEYMVKDRRFFDPPHFCNLIEQVDSGLHLGYYRDFAKDTPTLVTSNDASVSCTHVSRGPNIFSGVAWMLNHKPRGKPFRLALTKEFADQIKVTSAEMKKRSKLAVSTPLHGIGLVVKVDKNTQCGYRPLTETNGTVKKILVSISSAKTETARDKAYDPLMEIVTYVQFANDELDFGMGLELGLDIFFATRHQCLRPLLSQILSQAYTLSGEPLFADILTAHLAVRYNE